MVKEKLACLLRCAEKLGIHCRACKVDIILYIILCTEINWIYNICSMCTIIKRTLFLATQSHRYSDMKAPFSLCSDSCLFHHYRDL